MHRARCPSMSNQGDSCHDSEVDECEDPESISDPEPETEESHNDSRLSRCWFFEGTMNLDLGSFELDGDELPDIGQLQEYFGGSNCYKTAPLPPIRITYMHILANLAEAGRGGMFYTKFIGPIRGFIQARQTAAEIWAPWLISKGIMGARFTAIPASGVIKFLRSQERGWEW